MLLARRVRDGHHPLGEEVAALTLCAEAALPPEDESSQLALGVIVRRLDVVAVYESPQSLFVLEEPGPNAPD